MVFVCSDGGKVEVARNLAWHLLCVLQHFSVWSWLVVLDGWELIQRKSRDIILIGQIRFMLV